MAKTNANNIENPINTLPLDAEAIPLKLILRSPVKKLMGRNIIEIIAILYMVLFIFSEIVWLRSS